MGCSFIICILLSALLLLQSAILGMHNITQRAMVVNGTIQPRPMMYIALTYDHRLIDGREVGTALPRCMFTQQWCRLGSFRVHHKPQRLDGVRLAAGLDSDQQSLWQVQGSLQRAVC
jgi:hypothetical protein